MAETDIVPRTELEELQYQAGKITDESLDSTRRMVTMMEESEEAGKRTIECLDAQGEQIKRINEGMDNINSGMKKAEKNLLSMKRCCNICPTPWKKVSTEDDHDIEYKNKNEVPSHIINNQPRRTNGAEYVHPPPPHSGYITRITNDAREEEMDSNLCQVNSMLHNLRDMAMDMGTELEKQNHLIDNITSKGDDNNIRLAQVNITANTLLKN